MKTPSLLREEAGFSLTELMVVLVIIGILALMALPRFTDVTTRAKMSEAKMMLRQVHALQQTFRYEHDRYAEDLPALRFEHAALVTDDGTARYRISIDSVGAASFVARATAVVDFDQDGIFNVWQIDQEGRLQEKTPD